MHLYPTHEHKVQDNAWYMRRREHTNLPLIDVSTPNPRNRQPMPRINVQRITSRLHLTLSTPDHPASPTLGRDVPFPIVLARVPELLRRPPLQPSAPLPNRLRSLSILSQRIIEVREDEEVHESEPAPGYVCATLGIDAAPGREGSHVVRERALEEGRAEREVGELDEDGPELVQHGERVREASEHREHRRAGLWGAMR